MADTELKTRIVLRNDTTNSWTEVASSARLKKGEVGIEWTTDGTPKIKIGNGESSWADLPYFGGGGTEVDTLLASDLYAYTNIGKITASKTSPVKVASQGENLKTVFNAILGVQEDTQPTITTSGVKITEAMGNATAGTSSTEVGTAQASVDGTFQITLANSGTSNYGYRVGATKYTGSQTFYYPVQQQNNADVKITLPSGKTASDITMVTGTLVSSSSNILYCNFASKIVKIKFTLAAGETTTSSQTRFDKISYLVKFDAARKTEDDSSTEITKFLTYLNNDATSTAELTHSDISGESDSAWTIAAGMYYPYYLASTSNSISTVAQNVATISTTAACTSSGITPSPSESSYIWFLLSPSASGTKTIEYEALGVWYTFGDGTTGPTDVSITLNSGKTVTYKSYYTISKAAPGDTKFRIS